MKIQHDAYFAGFSGSESEYLALKAAQKALEKESSWELATSGMEVQVMAEDRIQVELLAPDPTDLDYKELLVDTFENTNLVLCYNGTKGMLRDTAIKTLHDTAKADGDGFKSISKENYAIAMTALLTGCRKSSQILNRAGKISAIVSEQYQYMPISELLDIADTLENTFGKPQFRGGSICHDLTTAQFAYPEAVSAISDAYNAVLIDAGRSPTGTILPIVQFRASDTSKEAAKLVTYLQLDRLHTLPLGGIKVTHIPPQEYDESGTRITCLEKFKQEVSTLFAKVEYDINELLPKMLDTHIEHPGNCLVGVCKYAGIPQKWGGVIEEDFRADWPDGSDCTFLDVYEAMTKATALALRDGLKPYSKRVLDLEEGITKVSKNRASWKRYDLPGTVAWQQK